MTLIKRPPQMTAALAKYERAIKEAGRAYNRATEPHADEYKRAARKAYEEYERDMKGDTK